MTEQQYEIYVANAKSLGWPVLDFEDWLEWIKTMPEQDFDKRHGGAWDRGSADSYYRRPYNPHKYVEGTLTSDKVESLSESDLAAYKAGWEHNERLGDFKEW